MAQLAKIGVRPDEIDIVINSHLHFDHCSDNTLFPQATFYFSKSELRHAYVPDPWERLGYDPESGRHAGHEDRTARSRPLRVRGAAGHHPDRNPGPLRGHLSVILRPGGDTPPMVFPIDVA